MVRARNGSRQVLSPLSARPIPGHPAPALPALRGLGRGRRRHRWRGPGRRAHRARRVGRPRLGGRSRAGVARRDPPIVWRRARRAPRCGDAGRPGQPRRGGAGRGRAARAGRGAARRRRGRRPGGAPRADPCGGARGRDRGDVGLSRPPPRPRAAAAGPLRAGRARGALRAPLGRGRGHPPRDRCGPPDRRADRCRPRAGRARSWCRASRSGSTGRPTRPRSPRAAGRSPSWAAATSGSTRGRTSGSRPEIVRTGGAVVVGAAARRSPRPAAPSRAATGSSAGLADATDRRRGGRAERRAHHRPLGPRAGSRVLPRARAASTRRGASAATASSTPTRGRRGSWPASRSCSRTSDSPSQPHRASGGAGPVPRRPRAGRPAVLASLGVAETAVATALEAGPRDRRRCRGGGRTLRSRRARRPDPARGGRGRDRCLRALPVGRRSRPGHRGRRVLSERAPARARLRRHEREPRDRRVAGEGEDDRTLPRAGLRRPRLVRPRPRPAREPGQGQVRRGRGARLRARVRGPATDRAQARRRHRAGGPDAPTGLPRHRPRPRGRGDRLARRGGGRACPPSEDAPGHLQRDHRARHPGGVRPSRAQIDQRPRRRAAGAPDRRPPRRLHAEPAHLAARSASGLSAGRVQSVAVRLVVEREREIRAFAAREYWTLEALLVAPDGDGVRRRPGPDRRRRSRRSATATTAEHARRGPAAGRPGRGRGRHAAAQAQPGAAVHDVHAPAGGEPQARLQPQADDVGRPAAVRGRRTRRTATSASSPTCGPTRWRWPARPWARPAR